MRIFTTVTEIQTFLAKYKNQKIGFVPTMGALHQGHLALVKAAKKQCDLTVVSIFVNPTQFAPTEDLARYPRPIEEDIALLKKAKVEVLFLPSEEEIYPAGKKSLIQDLPDFTQILEGEIRPTHFLGVAQVVKRLFEIIQPRTAFFGQKDFQQTLLIRWLIQIFNLPIQLEICPIVREKNGLALSSRNRYLSTKEHQAALVLSQTLRLAQKLAQAGEREVAKIEQAMRAHLVNEKLAQVDYAVIRSSLDLSEQTVLTADSIILLAVKIGGTRLIDNAKFNFNQCSLKISYLGTQ